MYFSDPELVELVESIAGRFRRSDFENLLVRAELYSIAELDDHLGEFAPILVKRDFVLTVLRDLRERGKLSELFEMLDDDLDVTGVDKADESDAFPPEEDLPPQTPPSTLAPITSRLRGGFAGLRGQFALLALALTGLGLVGRAFIILYGSNLCEQASPPPWVSGLLSELCPPKPTATPLTATATALPTLAPSTSTPTARAISVGVIRIPDYVYTEIVPKLISMGFEAEWIDYTSDYSEFSGFDVVYLPAGWGYQAAVLHDRETSFESFLSQGGGLFVERPNALDPIYRLLSPRRDRLRS